MKRKLMLGCLAFALNGCIFGSGKEAKPSSPDAGNDASDAADISVTDTRPPADMPTCGDGLLQPDETCDPVLPPGSTGACPADCDDGVACTADRMVGSAETCDAACASDPITACTDGDGCCPGGCDVDSDADCVASDVCGDGQVTGPELCDPTIAQPDAGACPATPADCETMTCFSAVIVGSACSAMCEYDPVTSCTDDDGCCPMGCDANTDADCEPECQNMVVEPSEICDGNCPASCDDNNLCTTDTRTGDASTCDVACMNEPITMCADGDGCCPVGCNAVSDDDCMAFCGNGVREPSEVCDGNCPASCDDNVSCTADEMTGLAATCDVMCTNTAITSCIDADGCCASGCNSTNDDDCSASCNNGAIEGNEKCDGNCPDDSDCAAMGACFVLTGDAANCSAECVMAPGCVACDLNAGCTCAADEECLDGRCAPGTGDDCTLACNPDNYCSVLSTPGWLCDPADDTCKSCIRSGSSELNCSDGADDDCDGFLDCDDADCPASECGHTLAITVQSYTGNLGNRAGANSVCNSQALSHGYDPQHTWRAVISTGGQSASQVINIAGPVRRADGRLLTTGSLWGQLDSQVQKFDGSVFTSHTPVWTGTTATGGTTAFHCSSWTAGGSLQIGGIGNANTTTTGWIDAACTLAAPACSKCNRANQLYCINRQ